jgi:hypothetical protein
MIERLGAAQIIDEVTGPRRADAATSAGTYLALAMLNRREVLSYVDAQAGLDRLRSLCST